MANQVTHSHMLSSHLPTGQVACLTHDDSRTLLADLGAVEHPITNFPDQLHADLDQFDILYLPGMFINSSGVGILEEFMNQKSDESLLAINLSATFIIEDDRAFENLV